MLIFGSFALIGLGPVAAMIIFWTAARGSDPLAAYCFIFAVPPGMLGWAITKKNRWHESESRLLAVMSGINTSLLFLDLFAIFAAVLYGCFFSGINPFAPAYSR